MGSGCTKEHHWNLQVWEVVYPSSELDGKTQIFLFSVCGSIRAGIKDFATAVDRVSLYD